MIVKLWSRGSWAERTVFVLAMSVVILNLVAGNWAGVVTSSAAFALFGMLIWTSHELKEARQELADIGG
ncbi:hypothetical protein [Prescottella agglutinans]|uniref:Uncharacterized protein n=1 Tax=Prescottella agglutinans TaxID=1644129 RepID=A0ABT6M4Y4_9NOCA|nr:hypothetical protein [Prescottella agglutinans]MDH6279362.1 hypothetical protein [Prescottella agglutinans]